MKVLFVVPYAPTLIRTRPYNLLRSLARRGHELTLATVWESQADQHGLQALAELGIAVLARPVTKLRALGNTVRGLASSAPLQAHYSWQPALANALADAVTGPPPAFDVVHVEHLRGAEYALSVQAHLRRRGLPTPVIWDSVDCITLLFEQAARSSRSRLGRWMARLELPRTQRYEGQLVHQFARVLTTSAKDRAALERLASRQNGGSESLSSPDGSGRIQVLPNGVDLEYFVPGNYGPTAEQVILSGKMSYHANVTAALHLLKDIMPLVWQRRPGVQVVLAGSGPPREIRALAERHAPRVTVTGFVPDLRPYMQSAAVSVAPVAYGAGIQNKVLEAMACGVPVVASPQAGSALQARPGHELIVATTDEEFAAAIVSLLEAPARRQAVGQAGRAYAATYHRWDDMAARLEGIYTECLAESHHDDAIVKKEI